MFFRIDTNNGVPIYEQLVRQVKFAIADGTLRPGQLLPGARTLAVELAINPNTVVRAFQELQRDDVLEPVRGRGLAVCGQAPSVCRKMRHQLLAERLRAVLEEASGAGLSEADIRSLVDEQFRRLRVAGDGQRAAPADSS